MGLLGDRPLQRRSLPPTAATADADNTLRIWDTESGKPQKVLPLAGGPAHLTWPAATEQIFRAPDGWPHRHLGSANMRLPACRTNQAASDGLITCSRDGGGPGGKGLARLKRPESSRGEAVARPYFRRMAMRSAH